MGFVLFPFPQSSSEHPLLKTMQRKIRCRPSPLSFGLSSKERVDRQQVKGPLREGRAGWEGGREDQTGTCEPPASDLGVVLEPRTEGGCPACQACFVDEMVPILFLIILINILWTSRRF